MVTKLCQHVQGHSYSIFCNNFFTSYTLIEELYHNEILCCGTLRSGQKEFPACLYDKAVIKRMKRGDVVWRMMGPVLALTWMNKKAVHEAGTYTQAPAQQLPVMNRKQRDGTRENPVPNWCHLTTQTWVVWIKMIR